MVDGRFTINIYTAWREQERERNPARLAALPGYVTIFRRFGCWRKAVAQMHEWRRAEGKGNSAHVAGIDPHRPSAGFSRRRRSFSDEQLLTALGRAYDENNGELSRDGYHVWRAEELSRGQTTLSVPCEATISERFGGWAKAIAQMHAWRRPR